MLIIAMTIGTPVIVAQLLLAVASPTGARYKIISINEPPNRSSISINIFHISISISSSFELVCYLTTRLPCDLACAIRIVRYATTCDNKRQYATICDSWKRTRLIYVIVLVVILSHNPAQIQVATRGLNWLTRRLISRQRHCYV